MAVITEAFLHGIRLFSHGYRYLQAQPLKYRKQISFS
jgi:hypothetical protein